MSKIIHLSDIHIGHRDKCYSPEFCDTATRFSKITEILLKKIDPSQRPDCTIVITGDLVDKAGHQASQGNSFENYETAKSLLKVLFTHGFKNILVAPGNHDYYNSFLTADPDLIDIFKQEFEKFKLADNLTGDYPRLNIINSTAFIGIDSMEKEANSTFRRIGAEGEMGEDQLNRLKDILYRDDVMSCNSIVLYMHHNPFDDARFHRVKDAEDLLEIIMNYNEDESTNSIVNVLLFGHTHNSIKYKDFYKTRCYEAGSATRKEEKPGSHRLIDTHDRFKDVCLDLHGCYI